jgi:thiamine biosynthesis protein ThiI
LRPSQDRSRIEVDGLLQLEIVDNEGKVNIFEQTHSISRLGLGGFDPLVEQGFSLAGVDSILGQLVGLGEALGQVSSQTLTNLRLIDNVSDTLILRPLISYDKEHIINLARQIGTEDFARTMPEYCGVISKSPTVKAVKSKIEAEEEKFDFSILDKVVEEANNVDIREIAQQTEQEVVEVETVNGFGPNDVILDIRSIDEQEDKPLKVEGIDVVSLPFYKLSTKFGDLDQNRTWLLWCERGVMSRLQALYLREQGFNNVKVYRP